MKTNKTEVEKAEESIKKCEKDVDKIIRKQKRLLKEVKSKW